MLNHSSDTPGLPSLVLILPVVSRKGGRRPTS